MADTLCGYPARDEVIVTYLYDDLDDAARLAFDTHLAMCARCRTDLEELRGVRTHLARWEPPLQALGWQLPVSGPQAAVTSRRTGWREIPAWTQVAAALLCVGVGAGLANLDVRYDRQGLSVRTGWSRSRAASPGDAGTGKGSTGSVNEQGPAAPPWRPDLTALERQLRTEFQATRIVGDASTPGHINQPALSDAELMRRVRALVGESERRQQRELALRVAELVRDVNAQRQADLRRIDQNLGLMQNKTNVEVLRNREMLNYVAQRVSSQRP
jgi:hypothetical protein